MPKKPDVVRRLLKEMREHESPSIDGSYVMLLHSPSPQFLAAAHPAYTPAQIEAERKAKGMGVAKVVYFIRDEQHPAPYWLSPARRRAGKLGDSIVFDVAKSRGSRRVDFCEVEITHEDLQKVRSQQERAELVLRILREAIAGVMNPEKRAKAAA